MSLQDPPTPQELAKGKKDFKVHGKLKFFCQLCKKQCPDKHGFACHISSDHHNKMVKMFAQDPDKYINEYSREFETTFFDLLRRKYTGKLVLANKVYQEYITDKESTHMNATKWTTLTEFVEYLTDSGLIERHWTEKGLFIQVIEKDPAIAAKKKEEEKRNLFLKNQELQEINEFERQMKIAEKIKEKELVKIQQQDNLEIKPIELEAHQPITFSLNLMQANKDANKKNPLIPINNSIKESKIPSFISIPIPNDETVNNKRKPTSGLETTLELYKTSKKLKGNETNLDESNDNPSWLVEGIVIKVKDKELDRYYNKKGKIVKVLSDYIAEVEILDTKIKLEIDQEFLETVIPKAGGYVKILRKGMYFGQKGVLESIHQDSFSVSIYIEELKIALELPFEMVSKISE